MSYDLTFRPNEESQRSDAAGKPEPAIWERILAGARQVLGEISVCRSDHHDELSHESTGIQISYFGSEVGITVPYWYSGAEAESIVTTIHRLAQVVEAATGFQGYDPQLDLPLAEAASRTGQAVAAFDRVQAMFREQ